MSTRKKVIVEYDESDAYIYDANGTQILMWPGLQHFGELGQDTMKPRDLISLKEAGFTAEDLVTMRDGGVI